MPAELVDEVPLRARDREGLTERPAALRHDRTDGHVVGQQHRDRAASSRRARRRSSRLPPGPAAADASPPIDRQLGTCSLTSRRNSWTPGTSTDRRAAAACRAAGPSRASRGSRTPSSDRRSRRGRTGRACPRRSRPRTPTARVRPRSPARRPRPRPRSCRSSPRVRAVLPQTARDVLERADVMRRREAHEQVGALAVEPFEDLAGHLADRLDRCPGAATAPRRSGSRARGHVDVRVAERGERNRDRGAALEDRAPRLRSFPARGTRARRARAGTRTCPARRRTAACSARPPRRRFAHEDRLERAVAVGAVGRTHEHDEVRRQRRRVAPRRPSRRTRR